MKRARQQLETPRAATALLVERETVATRDEAERVTTPQPLASARWDWRRVGRVLVVRLRSIGDTVLATPSLQALRRFLPEARIDILLEDWVAPVLEGSHDVDNIITVRRGSKSSRVAVVRELRDARYDVAFNLHGGTTATLLTRASGARHRVGFKSYRYKFLYTDAAPSPSSLWRQEKIHSVEQQLALLGWTGVPVSDRPPTRLAVTTQASASIARRLSDARVGDDQSFALIHPAAAFESKTWDVHNFARVVDDLAAGGIASIPIAAPHEAEILERLGAEAHAPVVSFADLSLPEITALASRARLFVGNDSGVAHMAAAVGVPSVVVFGSSNVAHWRPWTDAPAEVVREEMACAPCPGYTCSEFDTPECIRRVRAESVTEAVGRVLEQSMK